MADVVLFHHVQGRTDGVLAFAESLRADGHTVHTPDLFDGARPESIDAGLTLIKSIGGDVLDDHADRVVAGLPAGLVYAGISWGAMSAQRLAQTLPGARGVLLYESCMPITGEWAAGPWPAGLPVQIHGMDADPVFVQDGDLDAARELVGIVGGDLAELYLYPGDRHLFTDSSLPSYDRESAALVLERSRDFLSRRS